MGVAMQDNNDVNDDNLEDDSDSNWGDDIDMSGVSFDDVPPPSPVEPSQSTLGTMSATKVLEESTKTSSSSSSSSSSFPPMSVWQQIEHGILFDDAELLDAACTSSDVSTFTLESINMIRNGHYIALLRQMSLPTPTLDQAVATTDNNNNNHNNAVELGCTIAADLHHFCKTGWTDGERRLQLQLAGIAALNLFLQVNYTGPSMDRVATVSGESSNKTSQDNDDDDDDDFHDIIRPFQPKMTIATTTNSAASENNKGTNDQQLHNRVLAELAVDGQWPCQVCQLPYWLLVARTLLHYVTTHYHDDLNQLAKADEKTLFVSSWALPTSTKTTTTINTSTASSTSTGSRRLVFPACHLWSVRAAVSHARLFLGDEPSRTLWIEIKSSFRPILMHYCLSSPVLDLSKASSSSSLYNNDVKRQKQAATVILEWGLAQHFMDRPGKGRLSIHQAMQYAGLQVELTGAMGKRTKYQQVTTAQLQVKASSRFGSSEQVTNDQVTKPTGTEQSIIMKHSEDGILLEHVKYDEEESKSSAPLSILDQSILLALCLDVKNTNPGNDALTAEEMGAYTSRVLRMDLTDTNSADWMVYATALLERAWLEFESSHSKERAIMQLQALADQHSNRLSLTQSTFASVQEQSAPPQDRLRHLHKLVYPPRWYMIRDLAERYAKLGIVTSAAELFLEIEMWDQVVECYKRAGKERLAREIVEQRLSVDPTPRMYVALGDLSRDPEHYHKAIELSRGRFSAAYVALGQFYFDQGSLVESAGYYRKALTLRPLVPQVWFRLGAISMQLKDWGTALEAFSNVVQQEPEEFDAWANVAAVHLRNKCPEEAYPALKESLKYSRTNWRIWTSQLYTCIDLSKLDEAIQACGTLLDLQQKQSNVQNLEERCIKAIVSKTLALNRNEDSAKRTLSRLHTLLDRMSSKPDAEPWIWETLAYFHEQVGWDEQVLENLLKEYRALQAVPAWERDEFQVKKVVAVACQIGHFYVTEYKDQKTTPDSGNRNKEPLIKCRYLVKGVIQKIKAVHSMDESKLPREELQRLEAILHQVQDLMM